MSLQDVALYMNLKDYGGGFEFCNLSDDKIYDDLGEGTSGARTNLHNMELSQENTFAVDPVLLSLPCSSDMENFGDFGLCDLSGIQNSLLAVAEVYHNPIMHGLTKKLAEAKGKRSVEEIQDEAYIKKGKMKLVNDN
ncbi:hypothetical protein ES332_A03G013400v1 [Gossypium tomentosum]|uniref:Uncharacterized protein n=1 Tax=Gossypium tomentosum TaxID=34277 RepID=A0A5D2R1P0_GOSTO|nr:hypothetical protein ES332_A03G013400v1 [Gossypium tomentosum]